MSADLSEGIKEVQCFTTDESGNIYRVETETQILYVLPLGRNCHRNPTARLQISTGRKPLLVLCNLYEAMETGKTSQVFSAEIKSACKIGPITRILRIPFSQLDEFPDCLIYPYEKQVVKICDPRATGKIFLLEVKEFNPLNLHSHRKSRRIFCQPRGDGRVTIQFDIDTIRTMLPTSDFFVELFESHQKYGFRYSITPGEELPDAVFRWRILKITLVTPQTIDQFPDCRLTFAPPS